MLDTVSQYIYAVYQNKSVCKAAKQLYVSQPALSAAIKREEERLGFQIFNRKTLPLTLTAEGRCYIDAIEKAQNIQRDKVPERLQPFAITRDEVLSAAYDEGKMVSDLSLFHGVEFVYTPPQTTVQKKRKLLFGKEDLNPYITSPVGRHQTRQHPHCRKVCGHCPHHLRAPAIGPRHGEDINIKKGLAVSDCQAFFVKTTWSPNTQSHTPHLPQCRTPKPVRQC